MKRCVLIGLFLLVACSSPPPRVTAVQAPSQWYQMGYSDALAGKVVSDNTELAEEYGNPQIDRDNYLKGYVAGQGELCQVETIRAWAARGLAFPASCDGVAQAEQLKQQWQRAADSH
ncbi:DUF2799 domain-containing protein [Acerihabitans sp. TG2]|uniref:DUF2799 domain-containing protein n=1 Tax=Acerihabitans sp. TG2 TaxID=3096008 RepID=UPI002B238E0E|nr:DUF2799 domain-containing protein [Acerihabitans sp. TG2]MEA9392725.1 DUF2799 domain-containing protein [Acerihabitans sp. TG2]